MQGGTKDNPNPIVHSTVQSTHLRTSARHRSLGASAVRRFDLRHSSFEDDDGDFDDDFDDDCDGSGDYSFSPKRPATAEERSIYLALNAAASKKNANVLRRAGFFGASDPLPSKKGSRNTLPPMALRVPSFVPSVMMRRPDDGVADTAEDAMVTTAVEEKEEETLQQRRRKRDAVDASEIFDAIRNIQDPEHPLPLEALNVVRMDLIRVVDNKGGTEIIEEDGSTSKRGRRSGITGKKSFSTVDVQFTPTIPHCSMATLIGLSLRVKLLRSLPPRFRVAVRIEPGTHVSEKAVNKQLDDKERVRAALENEHLRGVVDRCIGNGMRAAEEEEAI